ncbi:MAG: hypothetical protein KAR16_12595 [Bacteroidales bacterium]|nr:hypothetical protein [Bacteroidales bacterium]
MTVDTMNNGDTMSYALGIGVDEYKGLKSFSHGGADLAHRAFAVYFPEINSGVVAMSNNGNFDAGKYILTGMGVVLEYSVVDGGLKMATEGQPEVILTPLSQTEFKYEGVEATVEFKTNDQGEVTGAVHSQGGQDYELEAVPPYEASLEELQTYTGRYFSNELDVFYNLELHDSTLVLLIRNTKEIKLSVVKEDVYKGDIFFIGELAFVKDESGNVTGFAASNGRTKGIGFERY